MINPYAVLNTIALLIALGVLAYLAFEYER